MFEDNSPESCITDGIPHLSFMDPETRTQFTWCGDPDHQIEVSPAYGEPVVERIPIPLRLRATTLHMSLTWAEMFEHFAARCMEFIEANSTVTRAI